MPRQILSPIDLRTQAQRQGVTNLQQTSQAIAGILQILGAAEQVRRERQQLDTITRAIAGGATTIEAINTAVNQAKKPQFGTGIQGILQRISGAFQPSPGGGIEQSIQQMTIGQRLKQVLMPKEPFTLRPGQTRFTGAGERLAGLEKPTKIQELVNEGYSREEAQMIRDISHGLKPRASARKKYEGMDDVEKMSFLSTLKQRAEGQYYGVEGGNVKPRQPKLLKWVNEELGKLPMLKTEKEKTTTDDWQLQGMITPEMRAAEPQSKDEFLKTVQSIEDEEEAKTYYNKWVSKWQ